MQHFDSRRRPGARSRGRGEHRSPLAPVVAVAIALLAPLFLPASAEAQYFGRNKVQYEEFDFRVLDTRHFQIHFYPEMEEALLDLTRMSERWYERLARTFQHEFERPKPLIFYADHPDFQQTNTLQGMISEGTGGVTESLKNRVIMPLTGSYHDTDHVLGHELVHAFQYNLAQSRSGGGLQGLTRLPLWLVEGMAEYLSVGREDPLTAMWLRDAIRRDDLPTIRDMTRETRYFPYRFGQALWAYIGGTYGDEAVVRLFRHSLRGGWERALDDVLGMSSDTLSARWRREVEDTYMSLLDDRTPPEEAGTLLLGPRTGAGRQNVSPSLSPDGRYVAFLSEKDLFSIDLYLADARTGEILTTLSSAASNPHFDALRFIDSSVTWSPDGSRVAFVVFADGDNQLVVVDTESGDVRRRIAVPEVGAIVNAAWSPGGDRIVFSGLEGGISDLYVLDLETSDVRQLTDDRNADFHPSWSPDGEVVVFASDRGPETDFDRLTYSRFQIAFLDVETGDVEHLPVFGNVRHSNPQFSPDGESVYFLSDQDGFSDIYRLRLATGEIFRVTRVATGVSGITAMSPAISVANRSGTLAFSVFDEFGFHIYTLDRQTAESDLASVARTESAPGRMLPPPESRVPSRVAAYLDDPLTGLRPQEDYPLADAESYEPSLSLDYVGQPTVGVGTDRFGNYAAGGASAFFSDMLGDRWLGLAVQAQGTFKDIGGQAFYLNRKKRWNWGLSAGRVPILYTGIRGGRDASGNQILELIRHRIFIDSGSGMVSYPFSRTRRLEASAGFTRYSFDVEAERFVMNRFGQIVDRQKVDGDSRFEPLNLAQGSVALVGDNSFLGFTSPVRGGRYRVEVENTFGTVDYQTLILDWRRYFNPVQNLTFGIRGLHFGRYGSDVEQNDFIRPMFLGYETFLRGYAWESFESAECSVEEVTGDSCPEFSRLFGHRMAVANVEMRVPVLGTDRFGLVNFQYLPTELSIFADAGLAWACGTEDQFCGSARFANPEFEIDRHTPARVPVFSTGISARVNVLGALIFEAYYAYPFQRPTKGGHWGFQLAPGW